MKLVIKKLLLLNASGLITYLIIRRLFQKKNFIKFVTNNRSKAKLYVKIYRSLMAYRALRMTLLATFGSDN